MHRDESTLSAEDLIHDLGRKAKSASLKLIDVSDDVINKALLDTAQSLRANQSQIIEKNKLDIERAKGKNLSKAQIDRLMLNTGRVESMACSLEQISDLPDPTGEILESKQRPNGLQIDKVTVPLGVLGMIYESRPNVTIDAAALALKSHNAVILRGGSESLRTSRFLNKLMCQALEENNIPPESACIVNVPDRAMVSAMLHADQYIDVMIPRGGLGLIERVMKEARMPVFSHLDGICHVYIDKSADFDIAKAVTINAKMRRTGICGAAETLLIDKGFHQDQAKRIVLDLIEAGCEVVGDETVCSFDSRISPAGDMDWATEYLDSKISVGMVKDVNDAIQHINRYGSHHTDSIIASDESAIDSFFKYIDSGIVMCNSSTQFADGGEFGMGAEIGISTGKLHARGPVGLKQLVTYKYIVRGNGQTRP